MEVRAMLSASPPPAPCADPPAPIAVSPVEVSRSLQPSPSPPGSLGTSQEDRLMTPPATTTELSKNEKRKQQLKRKQEEFALVPRRWSGRCPPPRSESPPAAWRRLADGHFSGGETPQKKSAAGRKGGWSSTHEGAGQSSFGAGFPPGQNSQPTASQLGSYPFGELISAGVLQPQMPSATVGTAPTDPPPLSQPPALSQPGGLIVFPPHVDEFLQPR